MTLASVRNAVLAGVFLGVLVSLGWHGTTGSAASVDPALQTCTAALSAAMEYGQVVGVARAERSTAAAVAAWQEGRDAPEVSGIISPLRSLNPTAPATVCLYRGQFYTPTGPPPPGGASPRPNHNVLRLVVFDDLQTEFDSAGYAGGMSPETPADWLAPQ